MNTNYECSDEWRDDWGNPTEDEMRSAAVALSAVHGKAGIDWPSYPEAYVAIVRALASGVPPGARISSAEREAAIARVIPKAREWANAIVGEWGEAAIDPQDYADLDLILGEPTP